MSPTDMTNSVLTLLNDLGMLQSGITAEVLEQFDFYLQKIVRMRILKIPGLYRTEPAPKERLSDASD